MRSLVAIACFFVSGCAGLIYEICWIRKASLVFGSTTLAVSTVVAVFFLGLALGSYLFGRVAQRLEHPLRLFALLEIAVGLLALLSLPAFALASTIYSAVYGSLLERGGLLFLTRVLAAGLVLLPPTILMGGTLPLFCRQFVVDRSKIAGSVGLLYAINTMGAALGCAAAGLWLLPEIGLRGSLAVGAAMSFAAGLGALSLRVRVPKEKPAKQVSLPPPRLRAFVSVSFFFSGFVAIGYEVLWTRYLGLLVRNTVYTYTVTLTVVLLGIVLGSLLVGPRFDRANSRAFSFGLLQILTGLSVLGLMMLPPTAWKSLGEGTWTYVLLLLPPSIFSGATFPLAVRMLAETPTLASLTVGRLVALNTFGGILGSFAVGFFGLPVLGIQPSLLALTGISLLLGFGAWILIDQQSARPLRWSLLAAGLLGWILLPRWAGTRIPEDFLVSDASLVDHHEGVTSNLAVVRRQDVLQLEIDRLWQGENRKNHQALAAHVPMLLHPDPRRVLVVGAGAGQTPARFLMYDVEHVGCVDIEPAVFEVIREHFESSWMSDPRVQIVKDDGRNFLAHASSSYDVISLEVGQIYRPGVAFFYTKDFYEQARRRLNPNGYLSQFVPLPFFTPEQFRGVVSTFLSVFPQSFLWYNTSELLLIGAQGEGLELDETRIDRLRGDRAIGDDLSYSHWGGSDFWLKDRDVFLASFLMGPSGLRELAQGGVRYRDDRPVLDYATLGVKEDETREIPILDLLRAHLEPVETVLRSELSADRRSAIARIRERNLGDIVASAYVRRAGWLVAAHDYPQILRLVTDALRWNGDNFDAHRMLAETSALEGRWDEAASHYQEAVRIRSRDARMQRNLGTAFLQLGRLDESIVRFRLALEIAPDDSAAHNTLGIALAHQGHLPEAIQHFEEALRLQPGFEDARTNLDQARRAINAGVLPVN